MQMYMENLSFSVLCLCFAKVAQKFQINYYNTSSSRQRLEHPDTVQVRKNYFTWGDAILSLETLCLLYIPFLMSVPLETDMSGDKKPDGSRAMNPE